MRVYFCDVCNIYFEDWSGAFGHYEKKPLLSLLLRNEETAKSIIQKADFPDLTIVLERLSSLPSSTTTFPSPDVHKDEGEGSKDNKPPPVDKTVGGPGSVKEIRLENLKVTEIEDLVRTWASPLQEKKHCRGTRGLSSTGGRDRDDVMGMTEAAVNNSLPSETGIAIRRNKRVSAQKQDLGLLMQALDSSSESETENENSSEMEGVSENEETYRDFDINKSSDSDDDDDYTHQRKGKHGRRGRPPGSRGCKVGRFTDDTGNPTTNNNVATGEDLKTNHEIPEGIRKTDGGVLLFKCYICQVDIEKQYYYIKHMKTQHLSENNTYDCPKCGEGFETLSKFGYHMRVVEEGIYPPSSRGKKLYTRVNYPKDSQGPVECPTCNFKFSTHHGYRRHRRQKTCRTHAGKCGGASRRKLNLKWQFKCTICEGYYLNDNTLKEHLKLHHPSNPHVCDYPDCKQVFRSNYQLRRHKRLHSDDVKKFKCNLCSMTLMRLDTLQTHFKRHHPNKKISYSMMTVSRRRPATKASVKKEQTGVEDEIRVHVGSIDLDENGQPLPPESIKIEKEDSNSPSRRTSDDQNPCLRGIQYFRKNVITTKASDDHHSDMSKYIQKRVHSGTNVFCCTRCDWTGKYFVRLRKHVEEHHQDSIPSFNNNSGTPIPKYVCTLCGFGSEDTHELNAHMKKEHKTHSKWKFRCFLCGTPFLSHKRMLLHVQTIHKEAVRLSCPIEGCSKKYFRNTSLQYHINLKHPTSSFAIQFAYSCKLCGGKRFISNRSLTLHVTRYHSEEGTRNHSEKKRRNHSCGICNQEFVSITTLSKHVQTVHLSETRNSQTGNTKSNRQPTTDPEILGL